MVLTCPGAQLTDPVAVRVTEPPMSEASRQADLLMVEAALQVTGFWECLMPLCEAGAGSVLWLRNCVTGLSSYRKK